MVIKNPGKVFEANFQQSVKDATEAILFDRIKDVSIPPDLRLRIKLPKNKYDCYMFARRYFFTMELKSTQSKSISFAESTIKQHQIDNLVEAASYPYVISGFIMNFRKPQNFVYFIPIKEFVDYKYVAENEIKDHKYKSKVNKSSIPIGICQEIGIEIKGHQKKVNWNYYISKFLDESVEQYELVESK